jgi:hypothetical protein
MRVENNTLNQYRREHPLFSGSPPGEMYGFYVVDNLRIISSGIAPWEHVSVSLANRCPTWEEMCRVKSMFWGEEETVVQFHPMKSHYINAHPYCLHLWKKKGVNIELPPSALIA